MVIKEMHFELGQPVQLKIPGHEPLVRLVWLGRDAESISLADNGKCLTIPIVVQLLIEFSFQMSHFLEWNCLK